jgi:hypothetical protein
MTLALTYAAQLRAPLGVYSTAAGYPKYVWDFVSGYRNAGFAVQRGSAASTQTPDGSFVEASADMPRFTQKGALLLEPASANLAAVVAAPTDTSGLYVTGAPEATLAVVEDTTALAAAGLLSVTAGKALLLDNTAGSSNARLAIQATVDSTTQWVLSAFMRSTGSVTLRTGYGGYPAIGSFASDPVITAASYVRASRNSAEKDVGAYNPLDSIWFDVSAGAKLWISCPQWEAGRLTPSSPIFRSASQTTRAAETLFLPAEAPLGQITATTPDASATLTATTIPGGALIAPLDAPLLRIVMT